MAKFEHLEIWKESILLSKEVLKWSLTIPRMYQSSIGDQIRRAFVSISCNIAEGSGSLSIKTEIRYLNIAVESSYESLSLLHLAQSMGIKDSDEFIESLNILIKRIRSYRTAKRKQQSL